MDGKSLWCLASNLLQKLVYLAIKRGTYPDCHSAVSSELSVVTILARLVQFFDCACFTFRFAASSVDYTTLDD